MIRCCLACASPLPGAGLRFLPGAGVGVWARHGATLLGPFCSPVCRDRHLSLLSPLTDRERAAEQIARDWLGP